MSSRYLWNEKVEKGMYAGAVLGGIPGMYFGAKAGGRIFGGPKVENNEGVKTAEDSTSNTVVDGKSYVVEHSTKSLPGSIRPDSKEKY